MVGRVLASGLGFIRLCLFTEAFQPQPGSRWQIPFRLHWIVNLYETPGKKCEFTNQTVTAGIMAILSPSISTADSRIPAATGRDRHPTHRAMSL